MKTGQKNRLKTQIEALATAVGLSSGRASKEIVERARKAVDHADQRMRFSGDDTVIALAGPTGSGKSSLFNAICQARLAQPGITRPTTTKSVAAYWGNQSPNELLNWLDVPTRHLIRGDDKAFNGLVLIDLPDQDSTQSSNRLEADRMIALVDQLIWVVDPQKYADAALHHDYLKTLASHKDVMMIAFNQADRLTSAQLNSAINDLGQLLESECLGGVETMAVSALTGQGIAELRSAIAKMVASKRLVAARLSADIRQAAMSLDEDLGSAEISQIPNQVVQELNFALAEAANINTVTDAVYNSMLKRGALATGWPMTKWLARFRPDPLKALHLDRTPLKPVLGKSGRKPSLDQIAPTAVQRTSLRPATGVSKARVDSALRQVAYEASRGLPSGWIASIRKITASCQRQLYDQLDNAVATTNLDLTSGLGWWKVIRFFQWLVFLAACLGGIWLLVDLVAAYLQLPGLPSVKIGRAPLATVLLVGGLLAGLVVGLVSRLGVEAGAKAKAYRAKRALNDAVAKVANELIISPVTDELIRHAKARQAVAEAMG